MHDLQVVVDQWSTDAEKTNEPTLLRRHLEALLDTYPMLRLITGDAIFAQRPLAELICAKNCDYLHANQGSTLDALEHWRIENSLHFLKDRWWNEDRHHTRRLDLSACMAAINNVALSIPRLKSNPDIPVRAAADYIAWSPATGIQLLNS